MINEGNNFIIEDIENLKDSNGLEFEGVANIILYNIVKKYGNNRSLVVIKDMSSLLDTDKEYLETFGIIQENKVEEFLNSSELLNKLLIIPKDYVNNYKDFIEKEINKDCYYTHICLEHIFTDFESYYEFKTYIEETLGNGIKDIIVQDKVKKSKSMKKGIDLELLYRGDLKTLKILNSSNTRNSILTLENTESTRKALAIDLSSYVMKFNDILRGRLQIIPSFNKMMDSIKKELSRTIIMLKQKKVSHSFYVISYYPNVDSNIIDETKFNRLSALILTQLLYDCNKIGIMPLMSTGQNSYASHYLYQILYNTEAMFIEDRINYLLNYPELSFLAINNGVLRIIGIECKLDLDITYIENQIEWNAKEEYEPSKINVNISSIDVISIKDDFTELDDDTFCNIAEKYRDMLTVLENSIEDTYMLNILQVIKFRYRKPSKEEDIRSDIDYDKVYIGVVNNLDYKLKTLVEKVGNNGIRAGISTLKTYSESNIPRLIPAILVDGGRAHMRYAKAILKQFGKCTGEKEQPRIDFKMIAPSNALILYNVYSLTNELYTPDRVNILDYCLYNEEAVKSRNILPKEFKKYISKKKLREHLTGLNCFGMYTILIGNNLEIDLQTLERF
ncbi:hypothetical protein [uncultured Clostridium sp.]|uniref:hypothetical protein n=1 Tax=uncultured Clostridium sp. TaxID=59620 RepID=UPI0026F3897C|nr:hypothetical protein [uncultured Clostridium sp.]